MTIPEYTVGAGAAAVATVWLDLWGVRTRVLADRRMPVVAALILFFMVLSNGWLTSRPIVVYDDAYRALPRLWTIPLEDFLFGFAVVVQAISWWEFAKRRVPRPPPPAGQRGPSGSR